MEPLTEVTNRRYEIVTPVREAKSVWPLLLGAVLVMSSLVVGWTAAQMALESPVEPVEERLAVIETESPTNTPTTIPTTTAYPTGDPLGSSMNSVIQGSAQGSALSTATQSTLTQTSVTQTPQHDFCHAVDQLTPCVPYITPTASKTPVPTPTGTPLGICKPSDYSSVSYEYNDNLCLKELNTPEVNPWILEHD